MQKVVLELDENLKEIALTTSGKYFKASTTEALIQVYETIDKLEKSKSRYGLRNYDERYWFCLGGSFCFVFRARLGLTRFRRIPEMVFADSKILLALWLVPCAVALALLGFRKVRKRLEIFAKTRLGIFLELN